MDIRNVKINRPCLYHALFRSIKFSNTHVSISQSAILSGGFKKDLQFPLQISFVFLCLCEMNLESRKMAIVHAEVKESNDRSEDRSL